MGGKKTVEKSREWEKERRDKLNVGFNDLCKLLPDHDPSISLSKMDILRRAAEYIRLLQEQNEEIIKSGDNDVLKNEADRLKKRVAYLLLKTKELVTALKAAGVPIPNNKKKKKKSKAQKVANGKDQNHIPLPTGVGNVGQAPCAVVVGNVGKPIVSVALSTPVPGKKVKCGCEKAAKKNPLSELNCTSAATTSDRTIPCHVTVVPSVGQPGPTILSAPVHTNVHALAPTLGPGTLIFRDGRVVTLPPAPVLPQILVKPQPTLIVMQRAPNVSQKRDKVPLIAPKMREITKTTYANKAPIPAIKTFRLESYPRTYKPKGKKKKDDSPSKKTPVNSSNKKSPESVSVSGNPSDVTPTQKLPPSSNLKRKGETVPRKTKIAKPVSPRMPKPYEKSDASRLQEQTQTSLPEKDGATQQKGGGENHPTIAPPERNPEPCNSEIGNAIDIPDTLSLSQKRDGVSSNESSGMNILTQPVDSSIDQDTADLTKSDRASVGSIQSSVVSNETCGEIPSKKVVTSHSPQLILPQRESDKCLANSSSRVVEYSNSVEDVRLNKTGGSSTVFSSTTVIEPFTEKLADVQVNENVIVESDIASGTSGNQVGTEKESFQDNARRIADLGSNIIVTKKEAAGFPPHLNSEFHGGGVCERKSFLIEAPDQFQDSNHTCFNPRNGKESAKTGLAVVPTTIASSISSNPYYIPTSCGNGSSAKTALAGDASNARPSTSCYLPATSGTGSAAKTVLAGDASNARPSTSCYLPATSGTGSTANTALAGDASNARPSSSCYLSATSGTGSAAKISLAVGNISNATSISENPGYISASIGDGPSSRTSLLPDAANLTNSMSSSGLLLPTVSSSAVSCGYLPSIMATAGSIANDLQMSVNSFSSASTLQPSCTNQLTTPSGPSSYPFPMTSLSSEIPPTGYFTGPSSLPVSLLNSTTTGCLQGHSSVVFSSHSTSTVPSSVELATCSMPHLVTTSTPHSYASTSNSLHVTPSGSCSTVVGPSLSNRQFPYEDGMNDQKTLRKPDADSRIAKDASQTATTKKLAQKSVEGETDMVVNSLDAKTNLTYQNGSQAARGSGKHLENSQCTKTSNMRNEAVTNEGSLTRPYSEHLDRANTLTDRASQPSKLNYPNNSTANFSSMSSSLVSNSQVYSFGLPVVSTESSRPETFFNYENPIASLPSDPFFGNFKPAEMPVSTAVNSGFGYSTYTTQAPPVRSVARQLFPADPLCSISNSYNLETNLPPLNSTTASQMFQFSSYSNTNSFRDPLLFTNDFLSTPTKNVNTLESVASEKEPTLNSTHSFHELIHPNTTVSSFSNIPCCFSVGQITTSATYVTSDFNRVGSDNQPNRKQQYQSTGDQSLFRSKHIPKSDSDVNFSMNALTSTADLKGMDQRNPSNPEYTRPVEASQNFNFPYLNAPQSLGSHMSLDSFNFNMRDPVQHPQNIPSHSLASQNLMNSSNNSIASKPHQKTANHIPQKSNTSKEFSANNAGSSAARGICDTVPPNAFPNDGNAYPSAPDKATQGTNNFHICGNTSQSSNQGVQTHQSYLYNPNSHQTLNKTHVPSAGSQIFSCSSQVNQIQSTYYNKKCQKSGQEPLYGAPDNHMKINVGQSTAETGDCSLIAQTHKNYQPTTSLVHTTLNTSSHSVNFSTSTMFSHSNNNRSVQGSVLGSYSSAPTVSQSIYSNPTTVASNQTYSQDGDGTRNTNQNLFRISHVSTNAPGRSNQAQNQSNLCSSGSQIFSTVESLAQQNLEGSQNQKPQSSVRSQIENRIQLDQTNVHSYSDIGTSQLSTQKTPRADAMSFSMGNLTGYSQSALPNESHTISKRSQNHPYAQVSTKQNANSSKTPQYPSSSSHNGLPPAKQCEYPLSSMLTGLNDPVLNSSHVANSTQQGKIANTTQKTDCNDKIIDKQYSTNTEGSSFKTTESSSCNNDFLQTKESDRSFIPIIEDVRLNSEFSNDLFSSLQVPTGGAHADSTSPTAAFLLAFPLVSTSKNADNPHESDPQDNNTSTPTTILQIGNIEPSNSELFHPLEFGKDMEPSDYLGQVSDKFKRKDIPKQKKPNNVFNSYSYPSMSGDYNVHYDQSWSDPNKNKSDVRKRNEKQNKFCGNNTEQCKDKKKKSKISVNWMAAPDVETYQKEQEASSFQASLSFPMDIDALPDICTNKKTNTYSWSPSKSLLPLDPGLVIPSTLPTLVGDLALGTPTPSDQYKRCDITKKQEKSPEKQNPQKSGSNFLSVSQLVDPKSKKKLPDKCKKVDKKKGASFQKRKDTAAASSEPCMYPDNLLPPLGWDKYRYRNNYSAEALIASQDVNESVNFTYQQNPNYFVGTELNQEHHHQTQQYQNSFNFSQNQFPPPFVAEDYQNNSFSLNNAQNTTSKRGDKRDVRCREDASRFSAGGPTVYQAPYPLAPVPPSSAPSHSSNFTSNTTTSVTNFNLSTIFPEINERTGSQGQTGPPQQQQQHPRQQQQQQHQQRSAQSHPHNVNTFQSSSQTNYRAHNL